uniref:NADH:ubiquinone reductase (H(+)-translocating) n=1 Tax=Hypsibius dujardini TaxID=232323 RepID=E7BBB2_HYPDU|nr:NADH dehydrogenase subunit 5 [Hypsibius dujardini]CBY83893.1 NADH dehydogenase subunit 5 [Hypsibius dujardini]
MWGAGVLGLFSLIFLSISFFDILWVMEWTLLNLFDFNFSFVFIFDFFSFFFSSVVLMIASMIFIFGQYYMDGEKFQTGFMLILFLFVVSMLFLVYSPNLISLLLGWDGLGLVSYLLVVYYSSFSSSVAGMLTFILNRVGDVFFLLSISLLSLTGSLDFLNFKSASFLLSVLLLLTFMTKSAQFPFSSWLPAAMAAPTPVSSLVHSSTLVTAGIFLMIRFSEVLFKISHFLIVVSLITLLMAGVMASSEWDMKKTIAFSTLSQLGFMMFSLSLGMSLYCFFHLLCHALFKASLFMVSGVMIHNMDSSQDFRNLNIFSRMTPLISSSVVVCLLCLCGFPFVSGFFSKDLILDGASMGSFFMLLFMFGVFLTTNYSLRFCFYSMKAGMLSRMKMFMFYDVVLYVMLPVWVLISTAIFLGYTWFQVSTLVFSISLFSSMWKGCYFSFFVLLTLVVYFVWFSVFKGTFFKSYFFWSMWYLYSLMSTRFSKLIFYSGRLVDTSQSWLEVLGAQGLYNRLLAGSLFFSSSLNFKYVYFIFPVFAAM